MGDPEFWELTAAEAAARLRRGELRAVEYARALLARQDSVEPALRALAWFDRGAFLERAERAEEALRAAARGKAPPAPLSGIPVGVKDNIDTAGVPTEAASPLHRGRVPARDAACLESLWRAGAYLHSKTACTELAFFDPCPTRNPWHLAHTPGGSSSGSAAGVAAGYFPLALGTQTAGSVIRPASYCGVVGFVGTQGSLPMEGVLPFAPSVDQLGIFARSVEDVALAAGCLSAAPSGAPAPLGVLDRPPFLGLVREHFVETAEEEMGHALVHAAKGLAGRGAIVHVVHLPESFAQVHAHHRRLMEVEMARAHRETFPAHPELYTGKKLRELIQAGLSVGETDPGRALQQRARFRADMERVLRELDALLMPASLSAAPYGLESTGDPRFSVPWTNIGLPVVTLPMALSSAGLPLGLQLVGAPGNDRHLLQVARFVEERLDWGHRLAPGR